MNQTVSIFRWVAFIAFVPIAYFIFSNQPYNWLYYLSFVLMMGATAGLLIYQWRSGERKKVKGKLVAFGIYALILLAMMLYQFYKS